ncbi:hypothetical protein ACPPVO_30745 [Dactylosporangium sp. McL0621]|uniref:hypothetical protein n=1 Tax=Dactylosporangium sp. McL0621 TaxID=3415678 RepID=UPI003CED3520
MDPEFRRDPWREVRRAPAWLSLATTWIALLAGAAHLFHASGRVVWVAGSAVLVAACVYGVRLLRARDRERQAALARRTMALWAVGLLAVVVAARL